MEDSMAKAKIRFVSFLMATIFVLSSAVTAGATAGEENTAQTEIAASETQSTEMLQSETAETEERKQGVPSSLPLSQTEPLGESGVLPESMPVALAPVQKMAKVSNNTPQLMNTSEQGVFVHAYLINDAGENIQMDGSLSGANKTIIATYQADIVDGIRFDEEVQYEQIDDFTNPETGKLYQYAGPDKGGDNPDDNVILTTEQPRLDVYLPYYAPRSLVLKWQQPPLVTFSESAKLEGKFAGTQVSLASLYAYPQDTANPIGLPAGYVLRGWSLTEGGFTIDYANTAELTIGDDDITLYAVHGRTTAQITINSYLVDSSGNPIDWAGNLLSKTAKETWVQLDSFLYSENGTVDLPVSKLYNNNNDFAANTIAKEMNGKTITLTVLSNFNSSGSVLDYPNTTFFLTEDMSLNFGYVASYQNTFHTNYPVDAVTAGSVPLAEESWVQTYAHNNPLILQAKPNSSDSDKGAYSHISAKLPLNYTFLGWSTTQYGVLSDFSVLESDSDFYPAGTYSILQPAKNMEFFAVWAGSSAHKVKIDKQYIVPYLVNSAGKPIDWDGVTSEFSPANITPINTNKTTGSGFGIYPFYNTENWVVGVYYNVYPVTSFTVAEDSVSKESGRTFTHNARALMAVPTKIKVDAAGKLYDETGTQITLYYGYTANYKIIVHSNFPSGQTSNVAFMVTDSNWIWKNMPMKYPNASLGYTPPQGHVILGYAENPDGSGKLYPYGDITYTKRPTISLATNADTYLHAIWVPESQVASIKVKAILMNNAGKPIDKNGVELTKDTFERDKVILNDTVKTFSFPYLVNGTTYAVTSFENIIEYQNQNYFAKSDSTAWYTDEFTTVQASGIKVQENSPRVYYKGYSPRLLLTSNTNYPVELGLSDKSYTFDNSLVEIGSTFIKTSIYPDPMEKPQGYVFAGWSEKQDGLNDLVSYKVLSGKEYYTMPSRNVTLYAQWKKIEPMRTYGTITIVSFLVNDAGQPLKEDGSLAASVQEAKVLNTTSYSNQGSTSLNLTATYYPGAKNYTLGKDRLLFNSTSSKNGGDDSLKPISFKQGQTETSVFFGYVVRKAYTITYDKNMPQDASQFVSVIGEPVYSNNYFAAGEIVKDELAAYNNQTLPTGFAYKFAGWTQAGSDVVYSKTGNAFTMPAADITLFAKWTPLYTVTFLPGENGAIGTQNGNYQATGIEPATKVVSLAKDVLIEPNEGWVFEGWVPIVDENTIVTANMVFTAQYKKDDIKWATVTFKPGAYGAEAEVVFEVLRGKNIPTAPAFTSTNKDWKFTGWNNNFTLDKVVEGNIVFEAQWQKVRTQEPTPAPASQLPENPSASSVILPTSSTTLGSQSSVPTSSQIGATNSQNSPTSTVSAASDAAENNTNSAAQNNEARLQANEDTRNQLIENGVPTFNMGDTEVPLFGGDSRAVWSLVNLILSIVSVFGSAILAVKYAIRRKNEGKKQEPKNESKRKSRMFLLGGAGTGIVSVLVFLFTQDLTNLMVVFDRFTPVFAILTIAQLVFVLLDKKASTAKKTDGIHL